MLISFSFKKNIFFYIPFFVLYYYARKYLMDEIKKGNNSIELIRYLSHPFLILIYFFENNLSKLNKEAEENEIKTKKLVFRSENEVSLNIIMKKKLKIREITLIICLLILNLIPHIINLNRKISLNDYHLDFLILFLINHICFNNNIYSHQLFSILLNTFFLFFIIYNDLQIKNYYKEILNILVKYSTYFSYLLIKYIKIRYFISVYLLGTIEGICTLLIYLIKQKVYNLQIFVFHKSQIFISILIFLLIFLFNFFKYKIINEFDPFYYFIFNCLPYYIYFYLTNQNINKEIFSFIIILISSFIYLEIIELNFCGFNKNLKKYIKHRGRYEVDSIDISNIQSDESID